VLQVCFSKVVAAAAQLGHNTHQQSSVPIFYSPKSGALVSDKGTLETQYPVLAILPVLITSVVAPVRDFPHLHYSEN